MAINLLTLIIAGWSCGDITIHGVSSGEEYMDNWWSRALYGENNNFIGRSIENHWVCVTWSNIRASISNTRVSYSPVKCWNLRHRQAKGGCWSRRIFPINDEARPWNVLHVHQHFFNIRHRCHYYKVGFLHRL